MLRERPFQALLLLLRGPLTLRAITVRATTTASTALLIYRLYYTSSVSKLGDSWQLYSRMCWSPRLTLPNSTRRSDPARVLQPPRFRRPPRAFKLDPPLVLT